LDEEFVGDNDGDSILEQHEKVELTFNVPTDSMLMSDNSTDVVNREFRMEIKPKIGAIVPITRVLHHSSMR